MQGVKFSAAEHFSGTALKKLEVISWNLVVHKHKMADLIDGLYSLLIRWISPHSKLKAVQKLMLVQPCDGVFYVNEI